jgi:hypothetical protein
VEPKRVDWPTWQAPFMTQCRSVFRLCQCLVEVSNVGRHRHGSFWASVVCSVYSGGVYSAGVKGGVAWWEDAIITHSLPMSLRNTLVTTVVIGRASSSHIAVASALLCFLERDRPS